MGPTCAKYNDSHACYPPNLSITENAYITNDYLYNSIM
jgi:hypothetical protein